MSRFLRSYGVSRLRPPTDVAPAVTFRPVAVTSAATGASRLTTRRVVKSVLRQPLYVTATTSTQFGSIRIWLVRRPTRQLEYLPVSVLQPPAVILPAVTSPPPRVELAAFARTSLRLRTIWRLTRPPSAAAPLVFSARPLKTTLQGVARASLLNRLLSGSVLQPPSVIAPGVTSPPLKLTLAAIPASEGGQRHHVKSTLLKPPVAGSTTNPAGPGSVKITLVRRPTRMLEYLPGSVLQPPAVILPALAFLGPRVELAPSSRSGRRSTSTLRRPSTIAAARTFAAARVALTYWRRPVLSDSKLRAPTVVTVVPPGGPPVTPIQVRLAKNYLTPHRTLSSRLQGPTVILPLPPPPDPFGDNWRVKERRRPPHNI